MGFDGHSLLLGGMGFEQLHNPGRFSLFGLRGRLLYATSSMLWFPDGWRVITVGRGDHP